MLLISISWAGQLAATPMLDQANEPPFAGGGVSSSLYRAQTFTVGIDGILSGFEVYLNSFMDGNSSDFEIWNTVGGLPEPIPGTPLASATLSFDSGPGFQFADISSFNLSVAVGDVLAIVQIGGSTPGGATWEANSNSYAGGDGYTTISTDPTGPWQLPSFNLDHGFRTYVDNGVAGVPAPGTLALFALGLFGLARLRRRKV